eukprot:UN04819
MPAAQKIHFLTAQHILWLKHHNKLVDELVSSGSELSEEDFISRSKVTKHSHLSENSG